MTAKQQLRERVETLTEREAERTLRLLDGLDDAPRDALDELLAIAPVDDEPTTPEEDEGAREARQEIARGEVFSAEQIKREIA